MDREAWWATVREVAMSQTRLKPLTTDHQEGACAPRNDGLIHKFAHLLQKALCDSSQLLTSQLSQDSNY